MPQSSPSSSSFQRSGERHGQTLPAGSHFWLRLTLAAYVALLLLTRPISYIDAFSYAKHIADEAAGTWAPGANPFFDFGHLLWRPLGFVFWRPLRDVLRPLFQGNDILSAGAVLIALSIIGGLCGAVLLFLLIARSTRNPRVACLTTVAYLGSNAVLYYTSTGMAYVFGIACQIGALYLLQRSLSRSRFDFAAGAAAGLLLGLSIVIWFPYVLGAAGVFCYAMLAEESDRPQPARVRVAGLAGLVAGAAAIIGVSYGSVMVSQGFTTPDALLAWITRSRYGKQPDRGFLRMIGGVPRGFLSLGDGSTEWKRILFEGRTVSPGALLATGIWKVVLVYLVLGCSVFTLSRSEAGRRFLVCLAALAIPLTIFAAILFEATPQERYMPAFPILFLAFAHVLADREARLSRAVIAVFFCAIAAVNLSAMGRYRNDDDFKPARARVHALNPNLHFEDKVILLSSQDKALNLVTGEPFNPESKYMDLFVPGLPWGTAHKEYWRGQFAQLVQRTWANRGNVWLSQRFLAAVPDPSWAWVEGDMPGLTWQDLPAFFRQLDLVNATGDGTVKGTGDGKDGFEEIAQTEKNRTLMESLIAAAAPVIGR